VRFPNVYGIDLPTRGELIATGKNDAEIAFEIGADALVYQELEALEASIRVLNPRLTEFDSSCFNGQYTTGDVTPEYLNAVEARRNGKIASTEEDGENSRQMVLGLAPDEEGEE
jgi:amidophosphoribosyltransferase